MKDEYAEVKRKIRRLKKWEERIRAGGGANPGHPVWDAFFYVKYPLDRLASMNRDEYRQTTDEFFYQVYYQLYRDTGMGPPFQYDPETLAQLGLPPDADETDIRHRFRELAKKHHPDAGGDKGLFIELMQRYNRLVKNTSFP